MEEFLILWITFFFAIGSFIMLMRRVILYIKCGIQNKKHFIE